MLLPRGSLDKRETCAERGFFVFGLFVSLSKCEIAIRGYLVLYELTYQEAVSIYPYLRTPTLALSYQLKGTSIACVHKGVGKVLLKQGKYNLFYLPADYQTANFAKGFCMNLFCELSPRFLEKLSSQPEKIKELFTKLNSVSNKGQMLQPGTIPHDFNAVKQDILKNSKRGTAPDLELEAAILRLLSNLNKNYHRNKYMPITL